MIRFAELYNSLDSTTKTNEKIAAMVGYFQGADTSDAAWATYFLSGQKLRRLVPTSLLRKWAAEEAGIPTWLLEESYHAVGDLAETLALIVPPGDWTEDVSLTRWIEQRLYLRKCRQAVVRVPQQPLRLVAVVVHEPHGLRDVISHRICPDGISRKRSIAMGRLIQCRSS